VARIPIPQPAFDRLMPAPPEPEVLERGLVVLVMAGGSAQRASEILEEQGHPVPRSTLQRWKTQYQERYAELHAAHIAELETLVLQEVREATLKAGILQDAVLSQLLDRVRAGEVETKDLTNILKAAGITLGINVEKMLLMTNRPTAITEKRDVAELLDSIRRKVPGLIVGDAEDITDVQEIGSGNDNGRP
jgi:hypothetical protein